MKVRILDRKDESRQTTTSSYFENRSVDRFEQESAQEPLGVRPVR
ncbi:MAG: hypothetical protein ABSA14_09620 [Acidimicrobiales bacterium]|jgi:hypothetical protein